MRALRSFLSRRRNWPGLLIVLFFLAVAVSAPWLAPRSQVPAPNLRDSIPRPPDAEFLLGTLPLQIDVYSMLVWGARDALTFGLTVALGAFLFGTLFGAVSGYAGGVVNHVMTRITDAFLTFPVLAGVVFLSEIYNVTIMMLIDASPAGIHSPGDLADIQAALPFLLRLLGKINPLTVSLILFSWMPVARLVNTRVMALKTAEFVTAARVIGCRPLRILRRHLLPHAIGPALVLFARDVGNTVLIQATFTFIGLGGGSQWGQILVAGRDWIIGPGGSLLDSWWVFVPVSLAIILFGIGWNALGDAIADSLASRR
jgi:peptide/nickel transport system permease protein